MTLVSNEEGGIASYAAGPLVIHAGAGGTVIGGATYKPAHMETIAGQPLKCLFSNGLIPIDPPPRRRTLPRGLRQPFSANDVQPMSLSMTLNASPGPGEAVVVRQHVKARNAQAR